MRGPSQILSDCPVCRVESALVELIDPSERIGVSIEGRCRMCGYATALGEVVAFGQPFMAPEEVLEALGRWAAEEGEPDVAVFAASNFNGRTPEAIAAAVVAGERVDTGFDVIAYLFPNLSASGRRGEDIVDEELPARPLVRVGTAPVPAAAHKPRVERVGAPDAAPKECDPRDITRALASVMLADGKVRPEERRFLDATTARLGAPPLEDADLRVWRPTELGPVPDPKGLIEAMRLLALCDQEVDGSELRLIQEFARAWGVKLPAEPLPTPGVLAELGRVLGRLLVR